MPTEIDYEAVSSNGRLLAQIRVHTDGQTQLRDRVDLASERSRNTLAAQIAAATDMPMAQVQRTLLDLADHQAAQQPVVSGPREATDPFALATGYLQSHHQLDSGQRSLVRWRGDYYKWSLERGYQPLGNDEFRARLSLAVEEALAQMTEATGGATRKPPVTKRLVADVEQAVAALVQLPDRQEQPLWISGAESLPPADHILAARNGLIDVTADHPQILPPTPNLFTTFQVDYMYDPAADCPRWRAFTEQVFGGDTQSDELLAEWCGYCLTPDTSLQKMLMVIGPPRSGKGTMMRLLGKLVGEANVINPAVNSLNGDFGLQPFLYKRVAIFGDVRLSGRSSNAVERLLSVSGEDAITVNRKQKEMVTARLQTRIIVVSNELPDLRDMSGALASRFLLLRTPQSWLDREDTQLTGALIGELPGILNWAIAGLRRLRQRGRFVQPDAARELLEQMRRFSSPVRAFVEDCCVVEDGASIAKAALYNQWANWCKAGNIHDSGDGRFGRDLISAVPGLTASQPRAADGTRPRHYVGIRLLTHAERAAT